MIQVYFEEWDGMLLDGIPQYTTSAECSLTEDNQSQRSTVEFHYFVQNPNFLSFFVKLNVGFAPTYLRNC